MTESVSTRKKVLEPWQADFASSWFTSSSTTIMTFPLDTMKVYWQAKNMNPRATLNELGFLGLYRGIQVSLLVNGCMVSLIFTLYECFKRQLSQHYELSGFSHAFVSGSLAGMLGSLVLCPTNCTKACLQIHGGNIKQAVQRLGFQGMYRGLPAEMIACAIGRGFYFGSYEGMKQWFAAHPDERKWWHLMASAAVTGVAGWTVIFPADLVKTKWQATPELYTGYFDALRKTYKAGGLGGFWVGYRLAVARSTVNAIIALPLFDRAKEFLHANFV
ncbi:mitochondrial arginine transporter BAC2-like protein [Perkinsela sp. CCAP 1560/4]|nr:mitochondrial arginine transporter BAC2-like protein [Perkinsela sp. CCAP 1560/4]|eukprot:KNH06942.1 mitochondrial arginine transporter BAC2-like protein [Perkinsela sp. CCAP 1560/4]